MLHCSESDKQSSPAFLALWYGQCTTLSLRIRSAFLRTIGEAGFLACVAGVNGYKGGGARKWEKNALFFPFNLFFLIQQFSYARFTTMHKEQIFLSSQS